MTQELVRLIQQAAHGPDRVERVGRAIPVQQEAREGEVHVELRDVTRSRVLHAERQRTRGGRVADADEQRARVRGQPDPPSDGSPSYPPGLRPQLRESAAARPGWSTPSATMQPGV